MRSRLFCLLVACLLLAPDGVWAAEKPDAEAALAFLAKKQKSDGSFGNTNQLALTGMCGLAFLSSGSTPREGTWAPVIRRAIRFLLDQQKSHGAFVHSSSGYSQIHNHGYALTFLAECYGMLGARHADERARVKKAIQAAVEASVRSQHENGGFGYFLFNRPPPTTNMLTEDETSTTISQLQALRAARNAGFAVSGRAIERATEYVRKCRHEATGGFIYSLALGRVSAVEGRKVPTFAITAASLCVLQALGNYEGKLLNQGIDYLKRFAPPNRDIHFFYYGHYYAAQVMHQKKGPEAEAWRRKVLRELAERQSADGSWTEAGGTGLAGEDGTILSTAWATQIALMDAGYLPLFEN